MKRNLLKLYKELNKFWRVFLPSFLIFTIILSYFSFFRNIGEARAEWWNDGWRYRKVITLDSSYVESDLENFPILIDLTDTDLSSGAQADGDDIAFALSDGTQLSHEIESYSSGALKAWVKIPDLSSSKDMKIYMYYGNSSVASQENANGVWDDNYEMVQHLDDTDIDGGAGDIVDSTSNANNGTTVNMEVADQVTGQVDGSFDFDGTNEYVEVADGKLSTATQGTISLWMSLDALLSADGIQEFVAYGGGTATTPGLFAFGVRRNDSAASGVTRLAVTQRSDDAANVSIEIANTNLTAQTWYHVALTSDGDTWKIYLNGVDEGSFTSIGGVGNNGNWFGDTTVAETDKTFIGALRYNTTDAGFFDGKMDEVRVSNVERSVDWLKTSYNIQNDPTGFVDSGVQEIGGGAIAYWSLDAGYGSVANDESSANNDGTISGATWMMKEDCQVNKCLSFDGTDDVVSATGEMLGIQTVNFWVRPDTTTEPLIDINGFANINLRDGALEANNLSLPTIYVNGSENTSLNVGEWQMVTVTTGTATSSSAFNIGKISSNYFEGLIDEVKVYNYVRSQNEINRDYSAGRAGSRTMRGIGASFGGGGNTWLNDDLVGHWKMDENVGTVMADSSVRNNKGSIGTAFSYNWYEPWYNSSWSYRQQVTIDNTKVDADLTNFPVLIKFDSNFNLSLGAQTDGDDILFTDKENNKLDHEIESYNSSTGAIVAWVEVSSLSGSVDTVLYMYYGNSSVANQENPTGVWDSNYVGVWHMNEDPSVTTDGDCSGGTKEMCDSTGNNNDGDMAGTMNSSSLVSSKIGNGINFDGTDDYLEITDNSSLDITGEMTLQLWLNSDIAQTGLNANQPIGKYVYQMNYDHHTSTFLGSFGFRDNTTAWQHCNGPLSIGYESWNYFVGTYDGTNIKTYLNGVEGLNNNIGALTIDVNSIPFMIGANANFDGSAVNFFNGMIDEVRISNVARSDSWIKTEYNNQNSQATFLSLGSQESSASWLYRQKITIDNTKVEADLTNFPVLVNLDSDPFLASHAQENGDDIVFTDSSNNKLDHEIELYNSSTGAIVAWVEVPSLSGSVDTTLYMYYGNASAPNQQNPTGVWNTDYAGVWHMSEDPSVTTDGDCGGGAKEICDSTSNNNDGDSGGTMTNGDLVTGQVGQAIEFDGTDDYIDLSNASTLNPSSAMSVSAWVYITNNLDWNTLISRWDNTNNSYYLGLPTNSRAIRLYLNDVGNYETTNAEISQNAWNHFTVVFSANTIDFYVNGASSASTITGTIPSSINSTSIRTSIGYDVERGDFPFQGTMDEVRISDSARSLNWITTEYNNQNSPSTFMTIDGEVKNTWYSNSWTKRKEIQIDETKVDSNLTNFPVLISLASDSELAASVQADGDDILFTNGKGTKLDHEIESYTSGTGALVAWVEVDTLASSTGTTLFMYYGNEDTTSQQNMNGTWDSNYVLVSHDGGITDSTSNGNNGTAVGNTITGASGKIGTAVSLDGTGDYVDCGTGASLNITGPFTLETWASSNRVLDGNNSRYLNIISKNDLFTDGYGLSIYERSVDLNEYQQTWTRDTTYYYSWYDVSAIWNSSTWYHLAGKFDGTNIHNFFNGSLASTDAASAPLDTTGHSLKIGEGGIGSTDREWPGSVDEVRISNISRSDEWLSTGYNSQNSPSTFSSLGSEEALTVTATWSNGKFGSCVSFDGTDDFVDVGNISTDAKTVSFWVKADTTSESMIDLDGGSHTILSSSGTVSANGFSNSKIYIDGIESSTLDTSWRHVLVTSENGFSVSDMDIGRISSNYFDGKIDEVRLYNRQFSLKDAQRLYEWGPSPVFHMKMDEKTGTTVYDSSTNENNITFRESSLDNVTWYNSSWSSRKKITIDNTKVASDLTNFPVMVNLDSAPFLAASAQIDGDDILFIDTSNNKLDHEIELYNSSTGELVAWVEVPSLSGSVDTELYMYYGNASALNQQNPTGVWDSDYAGVWHMSEDPSVTTDGDCSGGTKEICDSTSNNNDGDMNGTMNSNDLVSSKIGNGIDLDGSDDNLNIVNSASINPSYITISSWVKSTDSGTYNQIFSKDYTSGGSERVWQYRLDPSGYFEFLAMNVDSVGWETGASVVNDGSWHHLVGTWDGTTVRVYVNGVEDGTGTSLSGTLRSGQTNDAFVGISQNNDPGYLLGTIDELRLMNVARSANWIKTEYNNQNSPTTFMTIDGEVRNEWYDTDWTKRKELQIDATKVEVNMTNFPVLIDLSSDSDLVSNAQSDGDDILFTNGSGTKLDHEIETYTSGTGALTAWVELDNIASSTGTTVYMYFGNSIASNQENPTGVWSNDYKGVWHMSENPSITTDGDCSGGTKELCDSTSYNHDVDNPSSMGSGTSVSSKIGQGINFNGSSHYLEVADSDDLSFGNGTTDTPLSFCSWVYADTISATYGAWILSKRDASANDEYQLAISPTTFFVAGSYFPGLAGSYIQSKSDVAVTALNWHYLCSVYDGNGTTAGITVYIDGDYVSQTKASAGTYTAMINGTNELIFGSRSWSLAAGFFDGIIDDIQISSAEFSSSWIKTSYNSQNSPSTFFSVGSVESSVRTATWERGKRGSALEFDGTDDYLSLSDPSDGSLDFGTSDFSISAWIRSDTVTARHHIISKDDDNTDGIYYLELGDGSQGNNALAGRIGAFIRDSSANPYYERMTSSTERVDDGEWHHISMVVNRESGIKIYVDGVPQATETTLDNGNFATLNVNSDDNFEIGRNSRLSTYFDGMVDDVKLYRYARSGKQVMRDMANKGTALVGKDVAALSMSFEEGYGSIVYDESIQDNDGTLSAGGSGTNISVSAMRELSGKNGSALDFDGTNDIVTISDNNSLSFGDGTTDRPFSISVWGKMTDATRFRILQRWTGTGASQAEWVFGVNPSDQYQLTLYDNSNSNIILKRTINGVSSHEGEWAHFVATYDGRGGTSANDGINLYINGELLTETENFSSGTYFAMENLGITANSGGNSTIGYMNGQIDELNVYPFVLNQEEIEQDYNNSKAIVLTARSTASDGATSDNSKNREYCIPGDTSSCNPPVLEMKMDEKSGTTVYDSSGNGYDGTFNSSPLWARGKSGSGLEFDGTDDYVQIGGDNTFSSLSQGTIEGWFNINSLGSYNAIFASGPKTTSSPGLGLWLHVLADESIEVRQRSTDSTTNHILAVTSTGLTSLNNWYHIAWVVSSGGNSLYINGERQSLTYTGGSILSNYFFDDIATTQNYWFGARKYNGALGNFFNGKLDEFKIFDYARSQEQIAWSYNRGKPIAEWRFDECGGTTIHDESGNGNDGTLTVGLTGTQTSAGSCQESSSSSAWYNGRNGYDNSGINFDGTDDYISIADDNIFSMGDGTNNFTKSVSFWFNANDATNTTQSMIAKDDYSSNREWNCGIYAANRLRCFLKGTLDGSIQFGRETDEIINSNTWYHAVLVFDGTGSPSGIKIYVDGERSDVLDSGASSGQTAQNGSASLTIGASSGSRYFDGKMDEVKIYNYAMTAEQVKLDYNSGAVRMQ